MCYVVSEVLGRFYVWLRGFQGPRFCDAVLSIVALHVITLINPKFRSPPGTLLDLSETNIRYYLLYSHFFIPYKSSSVPVKTHPVEGEELLGKFDIVLMITSLQQDISYNIENREIHMTVIIFF